MRSNATWFVLAALSCTPVVEVGSDQGGDPQREACEKTPATRTCPLEPWGVAAQVTSLEQLRGQWIFCGGTRRYTGRSNLGGFYGGVGIELWNEGSTWQWAYLAGAPDAGVAPRDSRDWAHGTVSLEGGALQLTASDGVVLPWQIQLFETEGVLRNSTFEVWNFVR